MTTSSVLSIDRHDAVLVLTLNRPEARNALNHQLIDDLLAAFESLDRDPDLRVGIVTGAGGSFCSGMDLREFQTRGPHKRSMDVFDGARPEKPMIAAVEGHVLAGGLELALSCDLIVAGNDVAFGLPEVKRGLLAGGGGLARLPQRLPHGVAMEMALTGDSISAGRAHELGLVSRLSDPGKALGAGLELARAIAANAPLSVAAAKDLINRRAGTTEAEFWDLQRPWIKRVFGSRDAREGAEAFTQKRAPQWSGS